MEQKTFYYYLDDYQEYCESLNFSPTTLRSNYYNIRTFIEYLDKLEVKGQLRRSQLISYQKHLANHRTTKGHPLKSRSINKKIECVRGFLKYLAKQGIIPVKTATVLEYVKVPELLPTSVLNHAQLKKVLRKIDMSTTIGYRDRVMLELLYSSGLRSAELLSLDTHRINFENHTLTVMGKGRKERIVPIGKTALRYLESYVKAVRPFLVRGNTKNALFLTSEGNRVPYHRLLKIVHKYTDNMDLDVTVTPHTFRRSCTTELIRGGANIYHVKDLLGHETLDTLKHYAKLNITDLKKTHAKCHPREKDHS